MKREILRRWVSSLLQREDSSKEKSRLRLLMSPLPMDVAGNPYLSELVRAMRGQGLPRVDRWNLGSLRAQPFGCVIHVHWPDFAVADPSLIRTLRNVARWLILVRVGRWRGHKLVWTVHNLRSHDAPHRVMEELFWRLFLPYVDGVIHLSHAGQRMAERRFPRLALLPQIVTPHGNYRRAYAEQVLVGREPARGMPRIGFVGQVRPYKHVPQLLSAFSAANEDVRLLVAGRCDDPQLRVDLRSQASDPRIDLRLEHVPESELGNVFACLDGIVIPWDAALNSGSALMALSFSVPILAPATPVFRELQAEVGESWIRLFDSPLTGTHLDEASGWWRMTRLPIDWSQRDWGDIATATLAFYESVSGQAS